MTQITLRKSGDFYEAEGEQARLVAEALGIVLTRNRAGEPMAGLPSWRLSDDTATLEAKGYTVRFDA